MFDEVNFRCTMPDGFETNVFQTKYLDCLMDSYSITKEERLVLESICEMAERPLEGVKFSSRPQR